MCECTPRASFGSAALNGCVSASTFGMSPVVDLSNHPDMRPPPRSRKMGTLCSQFAECPSERCAELYEQGILRQWDGEGAHHVSGPQSFLEISAGEWGDEEGKKRKAQDGEEDKEHSSWEETQNPPSPQQLLCSSFTHSLSFLFSFPSSSSHPPTRKCCWQG